MANELMMMRVGGTASLSARLLWDTFTDTNGVLLVSHTMNVGGGWTFQSGLGWDIQSNQLNTNGGGIATANATVANGRWSMKTPGGNDIRIVGRLSDATNYWFADFQSIDGGTLNLTEVNGGVEFQRLTLPGVGFAAGDTVYFDGRGSALTVGRNGVPKGSYTSSFNAAATRFGCASLGPWTFDDAEFWT